ncbi:ABC transporter substrate-binding protein [Meridianimaribacter flavus]|uniref:PorZ N-terminal beta-propeller domain-containing protein n=1 Tax=Meridianimaribacter flavus TaxID=571115 RepID=A0ABY2G7F4_9FLAO|nr:ABC transporter substrate-binding protein [Meridianimaribacter flavus]TDY13731.1 hypothetical protein A8975_0326 [Meridianimaribacter flavus]
MKLNLHIAVLALIFSFNLSFAQDYSDLWAEHFSYLEITDVANDEDKIYVASQNSIFVYNTITSEIQEITTINGLSGEDITTIHYSSEFDYLFLGHESGLIEIVNIQDEIEVISVVDIVNKETIPPNIKRINHFYEDDGTIYISTNYGISVFNLTNIEFGDTYYIGSGNTFVEVTQTTTSNGIIYAACKSGNGMKMANLSNPNLIDATQWSTIISGNYVAVLSVLDSVYAVRLNGTVYEIDGSTLTQLFIINGEIMDTQIAQDKIVVTVSTMSNVYNENFDLIFSQTIPVDLETKYTTGTIDANGTIFIGTEGIQNIGKPAYGLLKFSNDDTYQSIHPDGPLRNDVFEVNANNNEVWTVFGGYSNSFAFSGGLARSGISHFKDEQWINKPYDSILSIVDFPRYLSHIAINPFNNSQVYISSYYSGLLEVLDDEIVGIYNQDNSTIVPFAASLHLTLVNHFDDRGVLWVANGRVDRPLNKFVDGNWTSYDFLSLINPSDSNLGFSSIQVDSQNKVYLGTFSYGLVICDTESADAPVINIVSLEQNMPVEDVRALALDRNNALWIGTRKGLRVLYNTSNVFEQQSLSVNEIVILDNGIPQELLSNQLITDIEVDGSNNKWVATSTSGIFYFSPDGQETIYHFTKDNSPLPSNTINDVSIDNSNGEVFIATDKGMVSFLSGGSKPEDELKNAFVYPNPVRPEYDLLGYNDLNNITKGVKIKGLTENVNVKITDIEGNLVAEAQSNVNQRSSNYNFAIDGGTGVWNGKNLANNVVATGVYLIMISDLDSFETKVLKLLIVR